MDAATTKERKMMKGTKKQIARAEEIRNQASIQTDEGYAPFSIINESLRRDAVQKILNKKLDSAVKKH